MGAPPSVVAGAVQVARSLAQVRAHAPLEHTCPAAQFTPHEPQLARSVMVVTQSPPQSVWLAGQLCAQRPAMQTRPS